MTEQNPELKEPSAFKKEWEAKKLLKRVKKKVRKQLKTQGYSNAEASLSIKQALNRIASNKPEKRAAGRGS